MTRTSRSSFRSRAPGPAVLVALAVLGACSSSSPSATDPTTTLGATTSPTTVAATPVATTAAAPTTIATTTTAAPTPTFDQPGPYPVGVTKLQLPGGEEVVVWYPAVTGTTGTFTYDVRDYNSPAVKALLTADIPATFSVEAGLDAAAADGAFPVALYSHGFSGINVGSSFLTRHLASYGVVVAAPDHPARDLAAATAFKVGDQSTAVTELLDTITLLDAENQRSGGVLAGHVDSSRIVAIGHSAGGGTVLAAAADPRIDAFVSMASGNFGKRDDTSSTTAPPPPMPAKPSLFLAGRLDAVAPWETVTKPAYDAAPSPSRLWVIDGVGHNGFDDFCTLGGGKGIIGIAEASGLGGFLDSNPQFKALGADGCEPPAVPVDQAWPVIRTAVTAFVLGETGHASAEAALAAPADGAFQVAVSTEQK